ncbi:hypothetical protein FZC83_01910 [Rossellomorea marisflavi]|uniref:Uncharacterized protein n=1 Tax=Rossellomorea marisflavi TaxID=189381 RepID=A0A5D4RZF4_9BACI|nr:hypothetical protein [Rossellomorea marisflavi]TYS56350.1 hypothetical protein FZC83_01910 [Rossellomorea marisflavi]
MPKSIKCHICKRVIKDEPIKHSGKNYHEDCFNKWRQEVENRNSLYDYICQLYKLDIPTGMIRKQIKEFQDEYDYKLKGMELTLRYFHETLDNKPRPGDGIGIIPFIYEEAKNHYLKQQKILESIQNMKVEEVTVHIAPVKYKRKTKKIDITAI